jgi:hypothetical protein
MKSEQLIRGYQQSKEKPIAMGNREADQQSSRFFGIPQRRRSYGWEGFD